MGTLLRLIFWAWHTNNNRTGNVYYIAMPLRFYNNKLNNSQNNYSFLSGLFFIITNSNIAPAITGTKNA